MKLWISGEVEADIGDSFRETMNEVETQVNFVISKQHYGNGMLSWNVIMVIINGVVMDSVKFNKRTKETDIKMVIDYHDFKIAEPTKRKIMFLEQLIKSVDSLVKMKIGDFDWKKLNNDLHYLQNNFI